MTNHSTIAARAAYKAKVDAALEHTKGKPGSSPARRRATLAALAYNRAELAVDVFGGCHRFVRLDEPHALESGYYHAGGRTVHVAGSYREAEAWLFGYIAGLERAAA